MANFSQAFGYQFYIVPLGAACVDLSTVVAPALGAGGFIDDSTILTGSGEVTESGTGTTYILSIKGSAYSLNGDGDPIRLAGLTDAALETDTNSEDVITYDDETKGFSQAVATSKSFTVNLAGVADFNDIGYKTLRIAEKNTVSEAMLVKFARVGPKGTDETVFGYGRLTGYSESIEAGSVCSFECSLEGYGLYGLELSGAEGGSGGICDPNSGGNQGGDVTGAAASVTIVQGGSGYTDGSPTGLATEYHGDASGNSNNGTGLVIDGTVESGAFTAVTISNAGDNYKAGDPVKLSSAAATTAGGGSGEKFVVQTLATLGVKRGPVGSVAPAKAAAAPKRK